ncbi:CD209 antigen-like protein C [Epinephelus fuscoguttatus]|uniref:CD209 antigen-like protein C n=1 Tax=Epinephelus fuscoguttatus TaxID=293821 RepID=UPI0020D0F506|nr:CD209 antigen-like protein C [Epinephelus fuscoguttatus]
MAEDIYAKPDLTKKVRFQTGEKDDRQTDVCDNVDTVRIYDNCWAEESTPTDKSQDNTTENQPQTTSVNVSPEKRSLPGAAAVFLGPLCLLLLVAVIALVVVFIMKRNRLWGDNASLASERDKLQMSYSDVKILNHNLTQNTRQSENDINNLTKTVDELQKQIETTCPANWIMFDNSCYLMSKEEKSWTDSSKACETHGARLVIISNEEEQEFISFFTRNSWIGLTDKKPEGQWKWVNGTTATTKYWKSGQPDNDGENEDCAQISNMYPDLNNWNDLPCSIELYFTCEKTLK